MIANIDALVGRHFATQSGNICVVKRLGHGAIRAEWERNPSNPDAEEFVQFVEGILGPLEKTIADVCDDPDNEAQIYAAWKRARHDP